MKEITCENCGRKYSIPLSANFIYFCPDCHSYNGCECEYGFWYITPCVMYNGKEKIATITGGGGEFQLESDIPALNVKLTKGYKDLEVYHEAEDIVRGYLNSLYESNEESVNKPINSNNYNGVSLANSYVGNSSGYNSNDIPPSKKLFQYNINDKFDVKAGTLLDAFSTDESGALYYWNKSSSYVTSVGADIDGKPAEKRLFDIPSVSAGGVSDIQRGVDAITSTQMRKKRIIECVSYVDSLHFIEKIIKSDKEFLAAARITRITSIQNQPDRIIIRCKLHYKDQVEFVNDIPILKSIQNYDELKDILTDFMNRTKNLDDGTETALNNQKKVKASIVVIAIAAVLFLTGLIGVMILGMKPESEAGNGPAIAGAVAIAGVFIGCIGAGIHFKHRK